MKGNAAAFAKATAHTAIQIELVSLNHAAFYQVPKILKTLFGTIKWTCLDIKGGLTATPKLLKGPSSAAVNDNEQEVELELELEE